MTDADEAAGRAAYLAGDKFHSVQPFGWRRGWVREQHAASERKRRERWAKHRLTCETKRRGELTKPRGQR